MWLKCRLSEGFNKSIALVVWELQLYNVYYFFRGTKLIGQWLFRITGWKSTKVKDCLEPIGITKCCVSILDILCQAFTVAVFGFCLFVGISDFSFVFDMWKTCYVRLRSSFWLGCWLYYALGHYLSTAESVAVNTSNFILLLLSAVKTSINTSASGCLPVLDCNQFVPCCKLSVFIFMKVSLGNTGWQRQARVLNVAKFCKGIFTNQGNYSAF